MKIYMCGVDYQHEMVADRPTCALPTYYMTVEKLKAERTCWKQCGIVELELTPTNWPVEQDFSFGND